MPLGSRQTTSAVAPRKCANCKAVGKRLPDQVPTAPVHPLASPYSSGANVEALPPKLCHPVPSNAQLPGRRHANRTQISDYNTLDHTSLGRNQLEHNLLEHSLLEYDLYRPSSPPKPSGIWTNWTLPLALDEWPSQRGAQPIAPGLRADALGWPGRDMSYVEPLAGNRCQGICPPEVCVLVGQKALVG